MKPHPKPGSDTVAPAPKHGRDASITLLLTMADTTWRVFVPALLGAGLGIWADLTYGSRPWLTFIGVVLGFGVAALLIRLQLRKVQED